jgi:hypothetical protein
MTFFTVQNLIGAFNTPNDIMMLIASNIHLTLVAGSNPVAATFVSPSLF